MKGAEANLERSSPAGTSEAARLAADKAWNGELSKLRVETADDTAKRIFTTALWFHTMSGPVRFCDANGDYPNVPTDRVRTSRCEHDRLAVRYLPHAPLTIPPPGDCPA